MKTDTLYKTKLPQKRDLVSTLKMTPNGNLCLWVNQLFLTLLVMLFVEDTLAVLMKH